MPHKKNVDWIKNQQFIFRVQDQLPIEFCFVLQQHDPRFYQDLNPPYQNKQVKIGFVLMKMSKTEDKITYYDQTKVILHKKPHLKNFVHATFTLQSGQYAFIPITEAAGDCVHLELKFFYDSDFVTFVTAGYRVILENEESQDPRLKKENPKKKLEDLSKRLHAGDKATNALGVKNENRFRARLGTNNGGIMKDLRDQTNPRLKESSLLW